MLQYSQPAKEESFKILYLTHSSILVLPKPQTFKSHSTTSQRQQTLFYVTIFVLAGLKHLKSLE